MTFFPDLKTFFSIRNNQGSLNPSGSDFVTSEYSRGLERILMALLCPYLVECNTCIKTFK